MEGIQEILNQAIERAGTHAEGQIATVQFAGVFSDAQDSPPGRTRHFTTNLGKNTERFLRAPSLDIIFEHYGLNPDGVKVTAIHSIIITYAEKRKP